jgi:hypothetical protein
MGKVKVHQEVLVKKRSFPFEEYGMIRGRVENINEVPYKDSIFFSKVRFTVPKPTQGKKAIRLKQGMLADAEIITEDASV